MRMLMWQAGSVVCTFLCLLCGGGATAFKIDADGRRVDAREGWDPTCNFTELFINDLEEERIRCEGDTCKCLSMNVLSCCQHPVHTPGYEAGWFIITYLGFTIEILTAVYGFAYCFTSFPKAWGRARVKVDRRARINGILPQLAGLFVGISCLLNAFSIMDPYYLSLDSRQFNTKYSAELLFNISAFFIWISFACLIMSLSRLTKVNVVGNSASSTDYCVAILLVVAVLQLIMFLSLCMTDIIPFDNNRAILGLIAMYGITLYDVIIVKNFFKLRDMTKSRQSNRRTKLNRVIRLNFKLSIMFTITFVLYIGSFLIFVVIDAAKVEMSLAMWYTAATAGRVTSMFGLFLVVRMTEFSSKSILTRWIFKLGEAEHLSSSGRTTSANTSKNDTSTKGLHSRSSSSDALSLKRSKDKTKSQASLHGFDQEDEDGVEMSENAGVELHFSNPNSIPTQKGDNAEASYTDNGSP